MSDDLISRKALLEQFIVSDSGHRIPEYDIDNFPITISVKDVKDIIRKAPTAFDKEKVVEELKSAIGDIHYTEDGSFNGKCIEDFEFIQAKTALELVEKGGIE
mgnify:CR=1 FL=1